VVKNLDDEIIRYKYYILILLRILWFGVSKNPLTTFRLLRRFSWLPVTLVKFSNLYFNLCDNRHGDYLKAMAITLNEFAAGLLDYFGNTLYHPEKVILVEEIVSTEIFLAMGLRPFALELPSLVLPLLDPVSLSKYIDKSENYGIPSDICSLLKSSMGMVLEKEMIDGQAVITTNSPCDNHLTSYTLMEAEIRRPFYRLDVPFHFTTKRASDYFVTELEEMITWLESHTTGRMDWNKLKEICETRNQWVELQMEYFETIRVKPAPMAGEAVFLPYWLASILHPGSRKNIEMFKTLLGLSKQNMANHIAAVPNEKFRVLIWNMPIFHFLDVFGWAENTWGVAAIAESLSHNQIPLIDTTSKESMLRGIGNLILFAPMARHSRGPAENYLNDLFFAHHAYKADMIWVGANVGCKKTMALSGMVREKCREKGIPILYLNMEVVDPRSVNHDMIKEQIGHFMENTMKAQRTIAP
jgi:hypothetical protein